MDERQSSYPSDVLPLVLLPGTLCDGRVFAPLQERLTTTSTQVVLTTRAESLAEAAEQMLAETPEQFALLGYSLGGMVAMEAALRAPERVRGLALVSTTPRPVLKELHNARRTAVEKARSLGMARFVREQLWPDYAGTAAVEESLTVVQAMSVHLGHEVFARQTQVALRRNDFRQHLERICCPTLVLAGGADRICPPEVQQELATLIPGSMRVEVPGAGHLALLEQADEVASAVAAWFNTLKPKMD